MSRMISVDPKNGSEYEEAGAGVEQVSSFSPTEARLEDAILSNLLGGLRSGFVEIHDTDEGYLLSSRPAGGGRNPGSLETLSVSCTNEGDSVIVALKYKGEILRVLE